MKKVVLIGNSITSEIVYSYLSSEKNYEIMGFAVDEEFIKSKEMFGLPVIGFSELSEKYPPEEFDVILAIGYKSQNLVRYDKFKELKKIGYQLEPYVNQFALNFSSEIGEGSIILPGTVLEPNTKIGSACVVWANVVVGHHSVIKDGCWLASGTVIAGNSQINELSFLGVGVTVSNEISIGVRNIIGGGVAMHCNSDDNEVYLSPTGVKHRFSAYEYDKYFLK